jgi:hypothetical protein
VTIAKRPSCERGIGLLYCCFYRMKKQKIFRAGTGQTGKSVSLRDDDAAP